MACGEHYYNNISIHVGWVQASIDSGPIMGIAPSASAGSTAAMEAATGMSSASPRGPRKLGAPFKSVTKKHSLQHIAVGGGAGAGGDTPPESPTLPQRRFK